MAEPSPSPAKVRVIGVWVGTIDADLDGWTVAMLREEVARRAHPPADGASDPSRVSLICSGRQLQDGSLREAGLKPNSKLLSTWLAGEKGKAAVDAEAVAAAREEQHTERLTRLWEAAKALAQRNSDGSVPLDDYNIELEDQSGQTVYFAESDKKAAMMGLMLHNSAKKSIAAQNYKEALDVLTMAEEAFSLCDPKFWQMIDNVALLQLDIVWCYFQLRDISCLSAAAHRLEKARKGIEKSHGKDSSRFRLLHGAQYADLCLHVRLELLEGVVGYYSGNLQGARKSLVSAHAKYLRLEVSDEAISLLVAMGYKLKEAKRALRVTGQDVQLAVDYLVEERAKRERRRLENLERQSEILEQKRYGKTDSGKGVDMQKLKMLASIGYEKALAAEALRINENDTEKALDILTNPELNCILQNTIQSREQERAAASAGPVEPMETDASTSGAAPQDQHGPGPVEPMETGAPTSGAAPQDQNGTGASSSAAVPQQHQTSGRKRSAEEDRRSLLEEELAHEAAAADAMADYDIDVSKEGLAIVEYLALLDSVPASS